ncbi:alpha/beta fold hydrolase [Kribbella sp. NPDC051620]|uniref:alpha/beta fold hydrolase n=1 Tax=Kribbella sp. NPDC051620 TaxID=3364120 RepID=UPI0037B54204
MTLTHEVVAADGRTLKYCLYGDEAGVPVIAHHGTPGTRWERPDVIAAIEETGLRVLLHGRPGYGSDRQPGRTVADVAADVELLADAAGWDRFAVTGFSGGGPHALATAALLPDRVIRCSTVAAIAPPGTTAFASLDWTADAHRGEHFLREQLTRRGPEILQTFTSEAPDGGRTGVPDGRQAGVPGGTRTAASDGGRYERMWAACVDGLDGWIDDYLALSKAWGFELQDIVVPVEVWFGSEDDNSTPAHAEWLATAIPGAEARSYPGGHDPDDTSQRQIFAALRGD